MNDEEIYDCRNCCFRDKTVNFCGFCMKRILDEMKAIKKESGERKNG